MKHIVYTQRRGGIIVGTLLEAESREEALQKSLIVCDLVGDWDQCIDEDSLAFKPLLNKVFKKVSVLGDGSFWTGINMSINQVKKDVVQEQEFNFLTFQG